MIFSLFVNPIISAWNAEDSEPVAGNFLGQVVGSDRQNILYQRIEKMILNNTDSRSISLANYVSTEWIYLIYRVVGTAYLSTSGFSTDGSTAITGKLPAYGTALMPGIGIVSSYNVSTMSIVSQADGTSVELYAAIACADDDTRLTTNA